MLTNLMASTLTLAAEAGPDPVQHVVNHYFMGMKWGDSTLWIWSAHTGTLLLAGVLTVLVLTWASSHIATGPEGLGAKRYVTSNPFAHMIEVICSYLRENTVRPLLHGRTDGFMPFLWSIFFFILFNNILGLIPIIDLVGLVGPHEWHEAHMSPIGGTATQNIFVTGALALISALVVNFAGVRELGIGGYLHHLTAGTPWYLWPLMIPIEIMGTVIKPVALAIRLFANMSAGHILMAVLFTFAGAGLTTIQNSLVGVGVTAVSAVATFAIYFLELFVAFLQAFVFMFLTTVFIGQLSHHHDEHEHGDAHGHEHAHA
jgi:F-type H+-transporting ATPase subunit a